MKSLINTPTESRGNKPVSSPVGRLSSNTSLNSLLLALNSLEMKSMRKDLTHTEMYEIAAEILKLKQEIRDQKLIEEMLEKNKPTPKWD